MSALHLVHKADQAIARHCTPDWKRRAGFAGVMLMVWGFIASGGLAALVVVGGAIKLLVWEQKLQERKNEFDNEPDDPGTGNYSLKRPTKERVSYDGVGDLDDPVMRLIVAEVELLRYTGRGKG